jgi:hypothetical protein
MTKGNLLKAMLVFAVAQAILASTASAGSQRARVDRP